MKKIFSLLLFALTYSISSAQEPATHLVEDFKKYYDECKVEGSFVLYDQAHDEYIFYNQAAFKPTSSCKICNAQMDLKTGVFQEENFVIQWDSVYQQNPKYTIRAKTGWANQNGKNIGWYVGSMKTKDNVYYFANCIQTTDLDNNQFAKARTAIVDKILADLKLTTTIDLKITPLVGDYYIFTTYKPINGNPFPSNGMYCLSPEGAVLFDTPWDTTQFQPLLDSIFARHQQKVIACISTHSHDDRTAGLEFFRKKGIKTYSSKQTYDLCKERNEKQAEFYFTKDTSFTFGHHRFDTYYPGEGHTKDNIVIWCNDAKIVYGGCLVKSTENNGLGYIADANMNEWARTIKNVMKKYPKRGYVIPGHFGWGNKRGLEHSLGLLKKKK